MDTNSLDDSDPGRTYLNHQDYANNGSQDDGKYVHRSLMTQDTGAAQFCRSRWERMRDVYSDQYLEIFQQSMVSDNHDLEQTELELTQLGAVTWQPHEKALLFKNVAQCGRHDLQHIANQIGTKSGIEVKQYLDHLQQQVIDRQLYERYTKNISHADIPAAIEIGSDCEEQLEQTADALAAFQEHYDHVVGQQQNSLPWLITSDIAAQLDASTEQLEESTLLATGPISVGASNVDQPLRFFYLSRLLRLSEEIFMNESSETMHHHWFDLVEPDETPSMTSESVTNMHDILLNLVRRIVQTTIFLAMSRIRATEHQHRHISRSIRKQDVRSALDVLNLPIDAWDYWTRLPRRRRLRVIPGNHLKDHSDRHSMSYDDVEFTLVVRESSEHRKRLSRSSSIGERSSSVASDAAAVHAEHAVQSDEEILTEESSVTSDSSEEFTFEDNLADQSQLVDQTKNTAPQGSSLSKGKRRRRLDQEHDEYLETIDQIAKHEEESRLLQILGRTTASEVKIEDNEPPTRPKVLRKEVEEVKVWSTDYMTEWEQFGTTMSVIESQPKRVKIKASNSEL